MSSSTWQQEQQGSCKWVENSSSTTTKDVPEISGVPDVFLGSDLGQPDMNPEKSVSEELTKPQSLHQRADSATAYEDDEDHSIIIKISVPGLEEDCNRRRDRKVTSNAAVDVNTSIQRKNRLFSVVILILVLLVAAVTTGIIIWSLQKQRRHHSVTKGGDSVEPISDSRHEDTVPSRDVGGGGNASGGNFSKTEWPELVEMDVDIAEDVIKNDRPDLSIVIVTEGDFVTTDFQSDRVRIFATPETYVVSRTPTIG